MGVSFGFSSCHGFDPSGVSSCMDDARGGQEEGEIGRMWTALTRSLEIFVAFLEQYAARYSSNMTFTVFICLLRSMPSNSEDFVEYFTRIKHRCQ